MSSDGATTRLCARRSFHLIVHRLNDTPLVGTRLPALVLDGWGAGESFARSHAVPAPGARWTLLLLARADRPGVDEHRGRLAAEAVTAGVLAGSPQAQAAVLVDPLGVVQYVADTLEDALDAVADFRMGYLLPIALADTIPVRRCPDEGRRRARTRIAHRRRAA
jgi:hypothetical protein